MDYVGAVENATVWINEELGIPTVPVDRKGHYPFSKGWALVYRLKLALVLLNAGCALYWPEVPCHRLALLLHFWLVFVTCELVFKNYPWREPLIAWMWKLHWAIPFSRVLLYLCTIPLLLVSIYLSIGCQLAHPSLAVFVCWFCGLLLWPALRESWHRRERSDGDYDQFSSIRPYVLTFRSSFGKSIWMVVDALRFPSKFPGLFRFVLMTPVVFCWLFWVAMLLGWVVSHFFAFEPNSRGIVVIAMLLVLALLSCVVSYLPDDVDRVLELWEEQTTAYARRIENGLRMVRGNLQISGPPIEGTSRFDQLAVHVPLLLREAKILKNSVKEENRTTQELDSLTRTAELVAFRKRLRNYGPYTTECCVS